MRRIFWSVVWILSTCVFCSAQTTLYFPQIANGFVTNGTVWVTAIAITNTAAPGSPTASGTIALTQDNGSPWTVSFNDEQNRPVASGSSIPFQVAGAQTRLFVSTGAAPLNTGFATVTSNLPVAAATVFFEFSDFGNARVAEAGVPASAALARQTMFAAKLNNNTGIAVANPGTASATITFQVLDSNGAAALPPVTRTVVANGHTALFLSELFPSLPQLFFGTMQITSSTPIVTTALLFEANGQFATFPVFPLP
jgi:hypothetical protein